MAELCMHRNYLCIRIVEELYPMDVVLGVVENAAFPPRYSPMAHAAIALRLLA